MLNAAGFREAKRITRKYAKTFYFASFFLTKGRRYAAYAVYAICRLSDESVDGNSSGSPSDRLKLIEENIASAYANGGLNSPLLKSFRQTVLEYGIPKTYFDVLVSGMRLDLEKSRYRDFNQLKDYCYRAAGVVGLIMLKIFGCKDSRAEEYAEDLGTAMQLTNIIRDIKEDWERKRLYLPLDELSKFGVSEQGLDNRRCDENFKALLKFQISRARDYYQKSSPGIRLIADARSRFTVLTIKELYAKILEQMEAQGYDVFKHRARVSTFKKLVCFTGIILKGRYL